MSTISETDINKIAHLARLQIDAEEVPEYAEKLARTFDFIAELEQADTDKSKPLAHPQELKQRVREDIVTAQDEHELLQKLAPDAEAGLYRVPKVIE